MQVRQDMVLCRRMRRSPELRCRNHFLMQKGIRRISGGCSRGNDEARFSKRCGLGKAKIATHQVSRK
jgi:hypothetical protein